VASNYFMIPILNCIYALLYAEQALSKSVLLTLVWAALFVLIITGLNLIGVQATARTNPDIADAPCPWSSGVFVVVAIEYVARIHGIAGSFP